jgi:hypothetical protein
MLAGRSTSKVRLPGGPHRARGLGSSRFPLSGAVHFPLDATVISPSLLAAGGSQPGQRLVHTLVGLAGGDQRTVGQAQAVSDAEFLPRGQNAMSPSSSIACV